MITHSKTIDLLKSAADTTGNKDFLEVSERVRMLENIAILASKIERGIDSGAIYNGPSLEQRIEQHREATKAFVAAVKKWRTI